MKKISLFCIMFVGIATLLGCQTMHDGAQKGGEVVGKAVNVGEAVTEGAVDGYLSDKKAENPYNR